MLVPQNSFAFTFVLKRFDKFINRLKTIQIGATPTAIVRITAKSRSLEVKERALKPINWMANKSTFVTRLKPDGVLIVVTSNRIMTSINPKGLLYGLPCCLWNMNKDERSICFLRSGGFVWIS